MAEIDVRPMRSLGLLSVAHAVNHAQAVIIAVHLPRRSSTSSAPASNRSRILAAIGAFCAGHGPAQLRRPDPASCRGAGCSGYGGILFGGGFALQAFASSFLDVRDPERRVAHRCVAAAPGRQRPARRAVPDRTARLRDQRPHRGRQRRHRRRRAHRGAAHRGRRLARRIDLLRHAGRSSSPSSSCIFVRERGTDRAAARAGGHASVRAAARPRRPRPALAVPDVGARWRRPRARRREPVRAHLPDPGPRPVRGDCRADVRRADRLLGPDAAHRRLAVGPGRPQAADHRRLPRRRGRVPRLPGSRARTWSGCGSASR